MNVHKQLHVYAKYFSSLVMNGGLSHFKDFKIYLFTLGSYKCVQTNGLNIFCYSICLTFQQFVVLVFFNSIKN